MTYLFSQLCWWIALALVIGLVTGWLTYSPTAQGWKFGWLRWGALAFVIGCVVALLKWLPDTPGFWLETALFLFASYIVGCFLGSWLRALFSVKPAEEKVALEPAPVPVTLPVAAADPVTVPALASEPVASEPVYPGMKPSSIAKSADGTDDLKLIRGIGPKNEKVLNDLGIYRFCQIGAWSADNAEWVGHYIAFPGRIERERWIGQGRLLCAGIETDYARQVKAGLVALDDTADNALTDEEVSALQSQLPEVAEKVENEEQLEGARPLGLSKPLGGLGDDLKLIKGIGKQNEGVLHGLGIWHFQQIAAWTEEHALWIGSYLAFPGRIEREEWVAQAKILAKGEITKFAQRVKDGEVATSADDGTRGQNNIETVDTKSADAGQLKPSA